MRSGVYAMFAAALVGAGLVPATGSAQAADGQGPRRVTVTVAKSGVRAPDSLAAGRYRMQVRVPGQAAGLLLLVKPDAGYTRAELRRDSRRGGREASRRIRSNLRFFGGTEVRPQGSGVLWETLYAGRYWLVGLHQSRPAAVRMATIRVHGTPFASAFPAVSATATSRAGALDVSRRVPRTGRILIRNEGDHLDGLFLIPLRAGADRGDLLRWLRRPAGKPPMRFRGIRSTMALSPGAGFVLRYRLRPGNYVVMGAEGLGVLFSGRTGPRVRRLVRPLTVLGGGRRVSGAALAASTQGFSAPHSARPAGEPDWPSWATVR